jgi:hypothetical protein
MTGAGSANAATVRVDVAVIDYSATGTVHALRSRASIAAGASADVRMRKARRTGPGETLELMPPWPSRSAPPEMATTKS